MLRYNYSDQLVSGFPAQANDRIYGGRFNASQRGLYKVTPKLAGVTDAGEPFQRSASHLMEVVQDDVELLEEPAILSGKVDEKFKVRLAVGGNSKPGTMP